MKRGLVRGKPMRYIKGHNRRRALSDRFWSKVDKTPGQGPKGECWIWTGCRNEDDYGLILVGRRAVGAHRVGYEFQIGPIPPGHDICHSCDDPPCVRGEHLFAETHAENIRDCMAKGRTRNRHGRLSPEIVADIRRLATTESLSQERIGAIVGVSQTSVGRVLGNGLYRPKQPIEVAW